MSEQSQNLNFIHENLNLNLNRPYLKCEDCGHSKLDVEKCDDVGGKMLCADCYSEYDTDGEQPPSPPRPLTPQEKGFLVRHYYTRGCTYCAKHLGRNQSSLRSAVQRMVHNEEFPQHRTEKLFPPNAIRTYDMKKLKGKKLDMIATVDYARFPGAPDYVCIAGRDEDGTIYVLYVGPTDGDE